MLSLGIAVLGLLIAIGVFDGAHKPKRDFRPNVRRVK